MSELERLEAQQLAAARRICALEQHLAEARLDIADVLQALRSVLAAAAVGGAS